MFGFELIKIYVPSDDLIRNKGKLTYICPKYIFHFAQILTIITTSTKVDTDNPTFEKPDKVSIKQKLFGMTILNNNYYVQKLIDTVMEQNINLKCV